MKLDEIIGSKSPSPSTGKRTRVYMTFSVGAKPIELKEEDRMVNFSEHPTSLLIKNELTSFSLRELIRQRKFLPKMVLRLRLREVANYCRSSSPDQIREARDVIIPYIKEYVNRYILGAVNNPSVGNFNIVMLLGLTQFMRNTTSARKLQRVLKLTKRSYAASGRLTPVIQKRLDEAYSEFWNDFITSVEAKYLPENKRGILSSSSSSDDNKESTKVMVPSADSVSDEELDRTVEFSDKGTPSIDSPETFVAYLEGFLGSLDDGANPKYVIDKLNTLKSLPFCKNKSNIKKLLDKEIFGDEILTNYIIQYVFNNKGLVELTRYLKNSLNPDQKNFSLVQHPWGRIQWSPDHLECFVPSANLKWYHFKIESPNSDNVIVRCISYPVSVPFKEIDRPGNQYINGTTVAIEQFKNQLAADNYILEQIDRLVNRVYNFSEIGNKFKWKVIEETKDYMLGYYIIGETRYEILVYPYNDNYNVEVRKHDVSEPIEKDISKNVTYPICKEYHGISKEEMNKFMSKFESGDLL